MRALSKACAAPRRRRLRVDLRVAGALLLWLCSGSAAAQMSVPELGHTLTRLETPVVAPPFELSDMDGQAHALADYRGKVVMINFWATWCPPCRREIPAFIRLQETYQDQGFTIIGIAIDTKQNAIDFVDPMGINYPILIGETQGIDLAMAYGNRLGVLPYTVIVDRNGKIVYTHRNELTFEEAEKIIKPLL